MKLPISRHKVNLASRKAYYERELKICQDLIAKLEM